MKKMMFLLVALVCFSFAGCTTTRNYVQGRDFDASKREQIIKGQSTKQDILRLFGEPGDKGIDEKYNEFWTYFYVSTQSQFNIWTASSEGNNRVKKLIIVFDQSDIVQNFVYSNANNPSKYH